MVSVIIQTKYSEWTDFMCIGLKFILATLPNPGIGEKTIPIIYHHHHHIALVSRISLTLSRHSSLSFIALGRSSGQHPVSSHSCWMYVRAGRPAFARPCVGVHKSTSLMSSSLLLQQCPASRERESKARVHIYIYIYIYTKARIYIYSYLLMAVLFSSIEATLIEEQQ